MPRDNEEAWLKWRREGFTASDAKVIANGNGEAWEALRHEKLTGEREPVKKGTQLLFDLGHAVEAVALNHFHKHVAEVELRNVQIESQLDPWFRATIDGFTFAGDVIEIKSHWMDRKIDELLELYWPQLQHQLFVTETKKLHFAVIFGHYARFEHEVVEVDEPFIEAYKLKAYMFKDYLDSGVLPKDMQPPPPVNIVRGRKHEWPINDNEIAVASSDWLANKDAVKIVETAEKILKSKVPDDAVSATWQRPGEDGVIVKVDKAGKKSLRILPKAG